MHGVGIDLLNSVIKPGSNVLDIGFGSGFVSAILAVLVGDTGHVYAIDHIQEFAEIATKNITKDNPSLLKRITLKIGDGFKGIPESGPYNAIYIGAAVEEIPNTLIQQLKLGGRMIVPVGPATGFHQLMQVDITATDEVKIKSLGSTVRFVPLTTEVNQRTGDPSLVGGKARRMKVDENSESLLILPKIIPAPDTHPGDFERLRADLQKARQNRKS